MAWLVILPLMMLVGGALAQSELEYTVKVDTDPVTGWAGTDDDITITAIMANGASSPAVVPESFRVDSGSSGTFTFTTPDLGDTLSFSVTVTGNDGWKGNCYLSGGNLGRETISCGAERRRIDGNGGDGPVMACNERGILWTLKVETGTGGYDGSGSDLSVTVGMENGVAPAVPFPRYIKTYRGRTGSFSFVTPDLGNVVSYNLTMDGIDGWTGNAHLSGKMMGMNKISCGRSVRRIDGDSSHGGEGPIMICADTVHCPHAEDYGCGRYWLDGYYNMTKCLTSDRMRGTCPYTCGVCSEEDRPTCEADPDCYRSSAGCIRMGEQANATACLGLGDGDGHDQTQNCKNSEDEGFTCGDCRQYQNVKTEHCPYMCGYCTSDCDKWCVNDGTLDRPACTCACSARYTGDLCQDEKCPGLVCENDGTANYDTCTCSCLPWFRGASCENKTCPYKEYDSQYCGKGGYVKEYCATKSWVFEGCPYQCGGCLESEKPTCEEDPDCYATAAGCAYDGVQATPEVCSTKEDLARCKNDMKYGFETCDRCYLSWVLEDRCPYMCGYCHTPCKKWCYNGGTIDRDACQCTCLDGFGGDDCTEASCTDKTPKCRKWKKTCDLDQNKSFMTENCPLTCNMCDVGRVTTV